MQTKIAAKKSCFYYKFAKTPKKNGVNDLFEIQIGSFLIHENIFEKNEIGMRILSLKKCDSVLFCKVCKIRNINVFRAEFRIKIFVTESSPCTGICKSIILFPLHN